jgi:hypothetical protein
MMQYQVGYCYPVLGARRLEPPGLFGRERGEEGREEFGGGRGREEVKRVGDVGVGVSGGECQEHRGGDIDSVDGGEVGNEIIGHHSRA